jgi:hypothetical protein
MGLHLRGKAPAPLPRMAGKRGARRQVAFDRGQLAPRPAAARSQGSPPQPAGTETHVSWPRDSALGLGWQWLFTSSSSGIADGQRPVADRPCPCSAVLLFVTEQKMKSQMETSRRVTSPPLQGRFSFLTQSPSGEFVGAS